MLKSVCPNVSAGIWASSKIYFLCIIFLIIHFSIVFLGAYSIHYSNGINVMDYKGSYADWMTTGDLSILVFDFTRWAFPIVLFLLLISSKSQKYTHWIFFVFVSLLIIFCTDLLYSSLIDYWQRYWIAR